MITRKIPSTGEALPILGMGTWQTFDVSENNAPGALTDILQLMYDAGGRLIDSSPMYGNAETVVGALTQKLPFQNEFFYATKVWTTGREQGIRQMNESFVKMKRTTMDLVQIHNLTDWKTHLKTLRAWKDEGRVRYIGITHYTDAMHGALEEIIEKEPLDFVQFNYSVFDRHAEKRLLAAAAHRGVATLINRPFGEGKHFAQVRNEALPVFAAEVGIQSWSQFFLAYIMAHPAVTCIIPATGNAAHAADNFAAGEIMLNEETRKKMSSLF